ncbi:hypothetical protein CPLU01_14058 [Colletotrichum plurivorum]|uniref:Uncharacterized protein n=1 Tax=Colletotrichum plurivorum TaxID=2175906 RepID=A0A8H6JN33_9PEZI|nr:hypothetical protein CPLU01_14058 [Colletotrichum plurivorum]
MVKTTGILNKSPELATETREDAGKVWSELGVTEVAREEPPDVTELEGRGELADTAGDELVRVLAEVLVEGLVVVLVDGLADVLDVEAVLDWRLDGAVEDCVVDVEVIDELVNDDNVENVELPEEIELERVPLVPELVDELEPGVELLSELGETLDDDEEEVADDDDDGVLDD